MTESKRVLLTGASRGIGAAIAEKLLAHHYTVIGTTRQTPFPEKFLLHPNFTAITADLGQKEQLKTQLFPYLSGDNAVDIVINNAGICEAVPPELPDDEFYANWDKIMAVNLVAPVSLTRQVLPVWKKRNSGILINITSRAAYRGDTAEYSVYAASKAALTAYGKSILRGYGKFGISVFTIAPGFTDTDMAKPAMEMYGASYVSKDIPMGEITPPDQIAELVLLLASGKVSHLSGSGLHMNGGSFMI